MGLAKILIVGDEMECSSEVLTIVSMLSMPSILESKLNHMDDSDTIREQLYVPESDHLTLLNIYVQWKRNKYCSTWCNAHSIEGKTLKKAKNIREQLLDIMKH